jgi:hypothetical protein
MRDQLLGERAHERERFVRFLRGEVAVGHGSMIEGG